MRRVNIEKILWKPVERVKIQVNIYAGQFFWLKVSTFKAFKFTIESLHCVSGALHFVGLMAIRLILNRIWVNHLKANISVLK